MDILIILGLILVNGLFAMSEIAIVSSKRIRLQNKADSGSKSAAAALKLSDSPSRFLSTVQIGITLIGIFNGAFGEASIVSRLTPFFLNIQPISSYAYELSLATVVFGITYASLILGELVPKRIAMQYPEAVAMFISVPMTWLSRIVSPFVAVLSFSTDFLMKILRLDQSKNSSLTEEDISGMLKEGATAGLFEKTEHDIVARALQLDDKHINTIMTPRSDIHYIDLNAPLEETLLRIANSPYSRFPVCQGGLDNIIGIVDAGSLFEQQIKQQQINIQAITKTALYVPETISAMDLLEALQKNRSEIAVVINEYGEVEGVVTLRDILKVLVGHAIPINENHVSDAVQRKDGSWLLDGGVSLDRFREIFSSSVRFPEEEDEDYHTIAGFIMHQLGHIPTETESVEWENYKFEVVDMDKHRIDRVLVSEIVVDSDDSTFDGE